jgi:hypothetical protein
MKNESILSSFVLLSATLLNFNIIIPEVEAKSTKNKEFNIDSIKKSKSVLFNLDDQIINNNAVAQNIFDNEIFGWNNLTIGSIYKKQLKLALPSSIGTANGFECRINCTDSDTYQIQYDLKFDAGFSFSKGGKVGLGFAIGEGVTGGRNTEATIDNKGGSFRIMWRTNSNGRAYLHPYVYYKDMTSKFGTDFQSSRYNIVENSYYSIRLTIKTNTSATSRDGYAKMEVKKINDTNYTTVWEKSDIRWSGNADVAKRKIKTFYLSAFRGGSNNTWSGTNGVNNIFIDNVNWTDTF